MTEADEIIRILAMAGSSGMKLSKLATHVYNSRCTLFETPVFADIYSEVQQTVLRLSKSSSSVIEATGVRGYYRLNPDKLSQYGQLTIDFDGVAPLYGEQQQEEEDCPPEDSCPDLSLSLFD